MNILLASERFFPSVGGVETVTRLLSEALVADGHRVTLLTNQPGETNGADKCQLVRRPRAIQLIKCYLAADAVVLQGPTIRLGWGLFCCHRPALMVHHLWPGVRPKQPARWLRCELDRRTRHGAVSEALARALSHRVDAILANPYDDRVFRPAPKSSRKRQILFVGRLIPEKGALILVEAIARLKAMKSLPAVTLVGAGPERERVEGLIEARGLSSQVRLTGQIIGPALAQLFHQHQILAVPSLRPEAFGLVALEAIACGCVVVGSKIGGLPEAIGSCGATVPAGDVLSLATALHDMLHSWDKMDPFHREREQHLARHRSDEAARQYLKVIQSMVRQGWGSNRA